MAWNAEEYRDQLATAIDSYDRAATRALVDELVEHARTTEDPYPEAEAKRVMSMLRRKRFFADMERCGDALIQGGQDAALVRRMYAQSLLDQSKLTAGIALLRQLEADTANDPSENAEARGLLGRAYKQAHIDAGDPVTSRNERDLVEAIGWYYSVYDADPGYVWHGINTVALLERASRLGLNVSAYPDADVMADEIASEVKARRADDAADAWDYATAAEACLATGEYDEALEWLTRYVAGSNADAFELAGTLRQFEEVWELVPTEDPGRRLIPYLRAELLQREGGRVDFEAGSEEMAALSELAQDTDGTYEGVLGTESFQNVKWLHTALTRARSVARVDDEFDEPRGTAFLVQAEDLGLPPEEGALLLTNSHVISEIESETDALRPGDAVVNFEIDELEEPLTVEAVIAESGRNDLDFTLFRVGAALAERAPIPIANAIPLPPQRVYIVGHPAGGRLKFSIYDNHLLNHDAPRLHYRTPTKGGSSGSPVMNRNWQLIGLHHIGDKMVDVPGETEKQVANEGIAIDEIQGRVGYE